MYPDISFLPTNAVISCKKIVDFITLRLRGLCKYSTVFISLENLANQFLSNFQGAINAANGSAENWLITFTQTLRQQLPAGQYIITHARESPRILHRSCSVGHHTDHYRNLFLFICNLQPLPRGSPPFIPPVLTPRFTSPLVTLSTGTTSSSTTRVAPNTPRTLVSSRARRPHGPRAPSSKLPTPLVSPSARLLLASPLSPLTPRTATSTPVPFQAGSVPPRLLAGTVVL